MRRTGTLRGFLLLALYVAALFGAPLAHEAVGADPHHPPFDRHDPAVSSKGSGGVHLLENVAACPVCQWTAANRASSVPALPGPHAPSPTGRLSTLRRDGPARIPVSPPSARSPPLG